VSRLGIRRPPPPWTIGFAKLPLCVCRPSHIIAKAIFAVPIHRNREARRPKTRSQLEVIGGSRGGKERRKYPVRSAKNQVYLAVGMTRGGMEKGLYSCDTPELTTLCFGEVGI
jgi:hypothetical protein